MIYKKYHKREKGFTAVELLITLFVAAVFLFAGYQLYTQVTRDGRDAEKMAKLSSIAYERAQQTGATVAASYPYGCKSTSQSTTGPASEDIQNIGTVDFTTVISCPGGINASADLFLVTVTASYKNNGVSEEVEHAIYAN